MGRLFLWIWFLGLFPKPADAHFKETQGCDKALSLILMGNIGDARQVLAAEKKADIRNRMPILIGNYSDFVNLVFTDNPTAYELLKGNEDLRIEFFTDTEERSVMRDFAIAQTEFQWGLIHAKYGSYWKAAFRLKSAKKGFEIIRKEYPDFVPVRAPLAFLNVLLGQVPENYRTLAGWIGLSGNYQQGIDELRLLSEPLKDSPWKLEAELFYATSKVWIPKTAETNFSLGMRLAAARPESQLLQYIELAGLMKVGGSVQALRCIQKRIKQRGYLALPIYHYWEGIAHLQNLEADKAIKCLDEYLFERKSDHYIRDAALKLFYAYKLKGDDNEASKWFANINKFANSGTATDGVATRLYENGMPEIHPVLLRSRLLYDGGNYAQAQEELSKVCKFNEILNAGNLPKGFEAEYYYRKGRILQAQNQLKQAVGSYEWLLKSFPKRSKYYYGAAACLQAGYCYLNLGQTPEAKKKFELVPDYRGHEYEGSFNNQAASELRKLNKR